MANHFPLEVYTPYGIFFFEQVEAISLTLSDGEIAVYANHVPFTAPVVPCILKIKDKEGIWKIAYCSEGILEVGDLKTILISDDAAWPQDIDYERAKTAKEQAEKTLAERTLRFETKAAASALSRANMRIKAFEAGQKRS